MSKSPKYLIDGYNLLFQSSLVGRGRGKGWLERARLRLLKLLSTGLERDDLARTQVVFDASQHGAVEQDFVFESGVSVVFANDHPEADDLLEELIRKHAHPKTLNVVSSDNRIRRAAKARKAISIDSEAFLDRLEMIGSPQVQGEASPAPEVVSEALEREEIEYWMREFGASQDPDENSN